MLAILATNLAGLIFYRGRRGRAAAGAPGRSWLPPIGWLLVSLFFLLPPLGAWRFGALSPYLIGLTEIDWIASLSAGGPLVALIIGGLLLGWLVYRHSLPVGNAPGRGERFGRLLRAPLDSALQQGHWAFYRALAIGILPAAVGTLAAVPFVSGLARLSPAETFYWGSWLGLGLIGLEWALNPFARAELRHPIRREAALRRVVLAIATTALFTITRNVWLCLACDLAVETVIAGWLPLPE